MVARSRRRWWRIRRRGDPHVDAGLQAERTAMAWQRTALGVGGVSALLLHESSTVAEAVPGVLGLMLTLLLIVLAEARYDQTVRHIVAGESPVNGRLVRLLATGTVLLAVSTLALAAVEAPA